MIFQDFHLASPYSPYGQFKIVVPLFGAAYAAPNKGTAILY